ncbi:MAG TPA: alpha-1,4-glucan--maltose-1-phosphate maltosyltransferase [Nitrospira sp.]|nr:alpha-1,4-glucan--maltose-1-phosphate maltosyltransferase [Nitrospira sp.]
MTKDNPEHRRVVVEALSPQVDCGRFPIKRVCGEQVVVEADVFADGHDSLSVRLCYRPDEEAAWSETPMEPLGNDRWRGSFSTTRLGRYRYTVTGWVDHFATWRRHLAKKVEAGQSVEVELLAGAELVRQAASRAPDSDAAHLRRWGQELSEEQAPASDRVRAALSEELSQLVKRYPDRSTASTYERELMVVVDRDKARFSAWYELFPRSCSTIPGRHGTFKDCETRLPDIASMGFDVLYLPPIHPIGATNRKGKNNATTAGEHDPGSPWAIGSREGGHKSVHPQLGTLDDFVRLVKSAHAQGLEVALDIAFQCSPDHPYVKEHREWFRIRPDGTVQYAENPPKKYEDIYPLDFETRDARALWNELESVFRFWITQGVKIFRVDNPHTKPFAFWEWVIERIQRDHPDTLFLSEAFTRPKVMYRLAKLGFSQSYNYFPWRNTKSELIGYFTELTQTPVREYLRPNLWPNTPDILTEYLQHGGRPAFMSRLVLAATLGASYGIYGPAFELCENRPREAGSEEYRDSEKYEIKQWPLDRPDSLREFIGRVNRIRRENAALQHDWGLRFHHIDNDWLLAYSKQTPDGSNVILVIVNLSPHHSHSGWLHLDLETVGFDAERPFQAHELLTNAHYLWHGARNYVVIDPQSVPAQIFRLRRRVRSEHDFDYFL